ncbi:MAG TPA: hypothetical protein VMM93_10445 [Vicinamibacterales bacterium]|nr:hypothetical protein [Vicinamibacterales bacterium]
MTRRHLGLVVLALSVATPLASRANQSTAAVDPIEPVVAIWYRGTPAGVPVQDELALLRALGFSAVVWGDEQTASAREVDRLADMLGLRVVRLGDTARTLGRTLALDLVPDPVGTMPARAWLALAGGVRLITIDAGAATGAGLHDAAGTPAPWVRVAVVLSRQVDANGELLARLRPGPAIVQRADSPSPARAVLLDAGRAWVLVVANPSTLAAGLVADLPRAVPFGPWVSLIDGHDMSMLVRPDVHEYRASLAAGEARVYVIDKTGGGR